MGKSSSHLSGVCWNSHIHPNYPLLLLVLHQANSHLPEWNWKSPRIWLRCSFFLAFPFIQIYSACRWSQMFLHTAPPPHTHTHLCECSSTRVSWQTPASMVIAVCAVLELYWCSTSPPQNKSQLSSVSHRLQKELGRSLFSDTLQPCWRTCHQIS